MSINKTALCKRSLNGFTLIEILVVIVIIGITLGFALIAFGDFGESKKILYAAEQVEYTIKLAQQQAIFENSTLGLKIDNTSYQLLKFQSTSKWGPVPSRHSLFKIHYLPKNIVVTLKTKMKINFNEPGIVINPAGETNSFTLNFGTKKEPNIAVLIGKGNGDLTLNTGTANAK